MRTLTVFIILPAETTTPAIGMPDMMVSHCVGRGREWFDAMGVERWCGGADPRWLRLYSMRGYGWCFYPGGVRGRARKDEG